MPELIRNGNIYLAMSPLYRVSQGKKTEYLLDDSELEAYRDRNKGKNYEISYFKGLGELNPDELKSTTLDPKSRRMKQVTMGDEKVVSKVFKDLMGATVSPRRKFIEENAYKANLSI